MTSEETSQESTVEEKSSFVAVGLKAVDHKCLNEEGESQRNAVTVQDLASWTQCCQCNIYLTRNDENQEDNEGSLQKFLESNEKPVQLICTDNSLECGKGCEDLQWNHCASTPRSETNGISGRAGRRVKEGTLQLGCALQDTERPESSSVLRKGTEALGQIRRVQFTTAPQRHANIRETKVRRSEQFKSKVLISAVPML